MRRSCVPTRTLLLGALLAPACLLGCATTETKRQPPPPPPQVKFDAPSWTDVGGPEGVEKLKQQRAEQVRDVLAQRADFAVAAEEPADEDRTTDTPPLHEAGLTADEQPLAGASAPTDQALDAAPPDEPLAAELIAEAAPTDEPVLEASASPLPAIASPVAARLRPTAIQPAEPAPEPPEALLAAAPLASAPALIQLTGGETRLGDTSRRNPSLSRTAQTPESRVATVRVEPAERGQSQPPPVVRLKAIVTGNGGVRMALLELPDQQRVMTRAGETHSCYLAGAATPTVIEIVRIDDNTVAVRIGQSDKVTVIQ